MKYFLKKRLVLAIICLVLFICPIPVSAQEAAQTAEEADENTSPVAEEDGTEDDASYAEKEDGIAQEVLDYKLPYPGILPDHPLYPLKLFRDRLLDFLIRDPAKRIEYNLLMADKRLNMGVYLSEKGNWELSEEIVSKGEKYFVNAVDELYAARDTGFDIPADLRTRLLLSIQKHRLVVDGLKSGGPENTQVGFDSSLNTISESHGRIVDFGI